MNLLVKLSSVTPNPPSLTDIYDAGLIDTLKNIYLKITELFTIFPVNVFLTLTLTSVAIALVSKAISSFRAAN